MIAMWTDNRRNDVRHNDVRDNDVRRNDYRCYRSNDVRRNDYRSDDHGAGRVVPNATASRQVEAQSTTVAHQRDDCRRLRSNGRHWRSLSTHR